jgi:hypothetical protein
MYVFIAPK